MRVVEINPRKLGCINLSGLRVGIDTEEDKLTRILVNFALFPRGRDNHRCGLIDLKEDKDGDLLMLEGHHRSAAAIIFKEKIRGQIYGKITETPNGLVRVNFERAEKFHDCCELIKKGCLEDLINSIDWNKYLEHLQKIKNIPIPVLVLNKIKTISLLR